MRAGLLILFAGLFFIACSNKNNRPDSVLPPAKMEAVLWDLMRSDQFLADYVFNKNPSLDRKTESIRLYQRVLLLHKISQETFRKSFSFYNERPELFKVIMDSVSKMPVLPPAKNASLDSSHSNGSLKLDSLRKDSVKMMDSIKAKGIIKPGVDSVKLSKDPVKLHNPPTPLHRRKVKKLKKLRKI